MSSFTSLILTYNNLNDKLILLLNSKIFPLIPAILVVDNLYDYKKFYILFTIIFIYTKFLLKRRSTATKKHIFEYYYHLTINFLTSGLVVLSLKTITKVVRPFCKNIYSNPEIINNIMSNLQCDQSFPSGHASFVIIFVLITQKYCNSFYKVILWLLVSMVSLSRIMIGAHSIIDILGALIIGFIIVKINHKLFSKYSTYIYNKYHKYFANLL